MSRHKKVTQAELARASKYSSPAIVAWTNSRMLKRVGGKYDLEESLAAIREHERRRLTDGGRPVREIERLRAQNIELKNSLLKVDLIKANREMPTGGMRPTKELLRAFSLLVTGVAVQLTRFGEHVAVDALVAGVLPVLCSEADRWLHELVRDEVGIEVAQCDGHLMRATILYVECLDAIRANWTSDDAEGAVIRAICLRAIEKIKPLPPLLSKSEYEAQLFAECLARGHAAEDLQSKKNQPAATSGSITHKEQ